MDKSLVTFLMAHGVDANSFVSVKLRKPTKKTLPIFSRSLGATASWQLSVQAFFTP